MKLKKGEGRKGGKKSENDDRSVERKWSGFIECNLRVTRELLDQIIINFI